MCTYCETVCEFCMKILNETLAVDPNFDLQDGTKLARQFFNQTTTIDGMPFYIDSVGKRRTDMAVKQFTEKTQAFEVGLIDSSIWLKHNKLLWIYAHVKFMVSFAQTSISVLCNMFISNVQ